MLTAAPLESARFGLRTYRASPEQITTSALLVELIANDVDLAILRVPPAVAPQVHALATNGFATLHADTLVTHRCDLQQVPAVEVTPEGFSIDIANTGDREAIASLVRCVFADYPNHYTANPLLAHADILDGYCEWALAHLDHPRRITWVARVGGRVAALACSAFDPATRCCEGVLHGVLPEFALRGIYTALIRHTQQYFRAKGYHQLTIKTQARNLAVQRVWAHEGFVLEQVQATVHVNALLDPAHGKLHELSIRSTDASPPALCEMVRQTLDGKEKMALRAALWAAPAPAAPCTLRLRSYLLPRGGTREITLATLHDATGRLCAIVRADTERRP